MLGVLLPAGTGTLSSGIVMGVISARMSRAQATSASGVVTASSGIVGAVLSPALAGLLTALGLAGALSVLAVPVLAVLPVAAWMCAVAAPGRGVQRTAAARGAGAIDELPERPDGVVHAEEELEAPREPGLAALLSRAVRDRGYVLLVAAFFTCGFHMAIIETHLVSQMRAGGLSQGTAGTVFAVYGVAAILGPVATGWLCAHLPMRRVLSALYLSRALIVVGFVLLPTSLATFTGVAVLLGLTGNSTVPPTSGLIEQRFGPASLGTLFGIAFLSHQTGAFLSAWLGGVTVTATGGYTVIWGAAAVLSVLAALAALGVREPEPAIG